MLWRKKRGSPTACVPNGNTGGIAATLVPAGAYGFTEHARTVPAHDDGEYNNPTDHPTNQGYGGLALDVLHPVVIVIGYAEAPPCPHEAIPEPAMLVLFGAGLAARRRRRP